MVENGKLTHAGAADRGHVRSSGQGTKAVVGADVGSRFFPADVLLPGGKCQNKASFSFHVYCFAYQPTRHVAHVLHFAGEYPKRRSSERPGDTKTLAFSAYNVGPLTSGIFYEPVCKRFRKGGDKKGLFFVRLFPDDLEVFNASEKIGRLDRNCSKIFHPIYGRKVCLAVLEPGKLHNFITGRFKIGLHHTTIMRVNQT